MRNIFLILALISTSRISHAIGDTARIFFDFNKFSINKSASYTLDSLENNGFFRTIKSIYIAGYADYVGDKNINNIISLQRSGAIKDYLAGKLFLKIDSVYITGFGNSKSAIGADAGGRATDRVVYIIINHFQTSKKEISSIAKGRFPIFIIKDGERINIPPAALEYMDSTNVRYLRGELDEEYAAYFDQAVNGHISSPRDIGTVKRRLATTNKSRYYYSYNAVLLSMLYGLQGKSELVFKYLNFSFDQIRPGDEGYAEICDPNILGFYQFSICKKLPGWGNFRKKVLARFDTTHIRKVALALQIIERGGLDQSIRVNIDADSGSRLLKFKKSIDEGNKAFVKELLRKYGYPSKTDIGEPASDALFLLVQHVSDDIAFQKNALNKMQLLATKNEINKENVALLTDRIMVVTTGRQLYGTQFLYELSPDGKKVVTRLYPVVDSLHLRARRKEIGL